MSRLKVRYATVFVLPPAGKSRDTGGAPPSPERLVVRRGDTIEWTVVNASGIPGRVTFGWEEGNPLKGDSAEPFDPCAPAAPRCQEGQARRLQVQRRAERQGAVRSRTRNHELTCAGTTSGRGFRGAAETIGGLTRSQPPLL